MNKNILIVGSLAIVLGAGSYWFNTKAVAVSVISPEQTRLQVTILATGQVQTRTSTAINTEIAGTVKNLVDEGQNVNTGDVLATLDDKDANSLYQQAAANLKSAELKLDHLRNIDRPQAHLKAQQSAILLQQAQRQLSHTATLAKTQQTTEEALATAQELTTLREADANSAKLQVKALAANGVEENLALAAIQQAQSQLQQAQHRQQRQTITSPFPAIVLERKADAGQYLKQGEPILTLSPLHQQEIIARLDERWLPQITLNQAATLLADAFPQEKFTATISHIAPSINDTRGTIEIRLKSPNWPTFLREGMTVSMELLSQQQAQAMVIPSAALQQSQNQYWLWLAKDGKAVRQNISIGQRAADKVQVISGLANNSQIIVSDKPLQAGQKISIHTPSAKGQ
jgi:HlyD family secretion protein